MFQNNCLFFFFNFAEQNEYFLLKQAFSSDGLSIEKMISDKQNFWLQDIMRDIYNYAQSLCIHDHSLSTYLHNLKMKLISMLKLEKYLQLLNSVILCIDGANLDAQFGLKYETKNI